MTRPRIGSLFSGYGGLDMGVQATVGGDVAWHCEIEPGAARLLEHHHPHVPNLGDITTVDWAGVEPVDVLTGGFPCQDVSAAGRRAGMTPDSRSGLWAHMARAINVLRPRLVVIENVRGLLSADAACDVEPSPWGVGDRQDRPLRALGAVLGDLAVLGYDARWCGLRAADAGAPHGRFRVFITAWPAGHAPRLGWDPAPAAGSFGDPESPRATGGPGRAAADPGGRELQRRRVGGVVDGAAGSGAGEGPQRQRDRDTAGDGGAAVADTTSDGRGEGRPESTGQLRRSDAAVGGDAPSGDADGSGTDRRTTAGLAGEAGPASGSSADPGGEGRGPGLGLHGAGGPAVVGAGAPVVADSDGDGLEVVREGAESDAWDDPDTRGTRGVWGDYEPAIRRWEQRLGRVAPPPTVTGKRGGQQLSPTFVEWMMGLPEGHVTGVLGLSRNEMLKMLGNGVVPQQAGLALRTMLADQHADAA